MKATTSDGPKDTEKREAASLALRRYAGVQSLTMVRVNQLHRVDALRVKQTSDDLDSGTLRADSYLLHGLTSALTKEEERKSSVGGIDVIVRTDQNQTLARNGEVLIGIYRHGQMMLAAGMRPAAPYKENPLAASRGDHGIVTVKKPTVADPNATAKVRWHVTPDSIMAYLLDAIRASCYLTPAALAASHRRLHEMAVDLLNQNFNYESAIHNLLSTTGFKGASQLLAHNEPGAHTSTNNKPYHQDSSSKEINDLKSKIGHLQRQLQGPAPHPTTPISPKPILKRGRQAETVSPTANDGRCNGFNLLTGCRFSPCHFKHECRKCGSLDHGAHACTQ